MPSKSEDSEEPSIQVLFNSLLLDKLSERNLSTGIFVNIIFLFYYNVFVNSLRIPYMQMRYLLSFQFALEYRICKEKAKEYMTAGEIKVIKIKPCIS